MIVVRPAADNWNKIGEYEPIIVENAEQTHKWHIASINDWRLCESSFSSRPMRIFIITGQVSSWKNLNLFLKYVSLSA